jgi:DNA-binding winged helix-turn-helix (wHTH) protein/tetratricopeptide (TPR) repeat protein
MKSFYSFRLDTINHCVWRGQERVALAPKAFDVLRYLVEHADRLVTQEEILEALWPETYVNAEVVKKYVLGIRKVLGDQSDNPTFIATFPRRGYQFIAPVRDGAGASGPNPQTAAARVIVGRASALAQLDGAMARAGSGHRQIVFITGEAGVGKTTLLDTFLEKIAISDNVRVARGNCVEGFGGKEAYYPLLDALSHLMRYSEDDPLFQAISRRAPTWLVQFPSLVPAERREALQREILGATRDRMVREICEALEAISCTTPLVLCLEDLHWGDPSTLDFVSALARRHGSAKLLLLVTYRPADVIVSQSPLKLLKQDLLVHNLSEELAVERLDESEVAEYIRAEFSPAGFPDGFADVVYQLCGGNALFMSIILKDLVKKRLLVKAGSHWKLQVALAEIAENVPETLDQLIASQFQQLSELEQRVLKVASVAGEHFSLWAISGALDLEPTDIETACEQLSQRVQFIKFAGIHELANGEISAHYEFIHSLYREVLYRRLSDVARSRLHLLLARRLKAFCDPCELELASELAAHFEEGYEYDEAIHYLLLAAENAAGRLAFRDAVGILQHGLELTGKVSQSRRAELQVQLLEFIGYAQFALGALADSAESYEAAAARAEQAGLAGAQGRALISAMYPLGFIDPDRGLAALDRAVRMAMTAGDATLLARAQMMSASCHLVFDTWSKSDASLCSQAAETLARMGELNGPAYQRMAYAHVLAMQGRYSEGLEQLNALPSNAEHANGMLTHFGMLSGKTQIFLRMGRLGEVLRMAREGKEYAEENLSQTWLLSLREAWVRILAWDFEGVERICQSISAGNSEYSSAQTESVEKFAAGHAALERGDWRSAVEHFQAATELAGAAKFFLNWALRITAGFGLTEAWLSAGDLQNAAGSADQFATAALATEDPYLRALAWELKARLAMAQADLAAAQGCIDQALEIVQAYEIVTAAWRVHSTASEVCRLAGQYERAEEARRAAELAIMTMADSLEADEPLRDTFLSAAPIRRILHSEPAYAGGVTTPQGPLLVGTLVRRR